MAIRVRDTLKSWFQSGDYPTENQFSDWIDSFFHKNEDSIPIENVDGLQEALDSKDPVAEDSNTNTDTTVEPPGIVQLITGDVAGFSIALFKVVFVAGSEMPVHDIQINNAGDILRDEASYYWEELEDYELSCEALGSNLQLTITFGSGPAEIIVKKPKIEYL